LSSAVVTARPILGPRAHHADLLVLRGWLALEAGALGDARTHLKAALDSRFQPGPPERWWLGPQPMFDFYARPLAEMGLEWLEANQ
jgi:hypothetical protein